MRDPCGTEVLGEGRLLRRLRASTICQAASSSHGRPKQERVRVAPDCRHNDSPQMAPKLAPPLTRSSLCSSRSIMERLMSEGPRPCHPLTRIRHQRDGVLEPGKTSAHDRQRAVVIVISEKPCLPPPHGIKVAGLHPLLVDRFYIEIGIRHKVGGILPVVGVKNLGYGMCRAATNKGFQGGVENGIPNDQMTILMILVPASAPVRNNDVWLVLPDSITNCQSAFFVKWNFRVGVRQKYCLCPEQASCFLSGGALHFSVTMNSNVFRRSLLSEGKAEQNAGSSPADLLGEDGAHGE